MTATPSDNFDPSLANPALDSEKTDALLQSLRRKQGNWVEWGKVCQQLQKAGLTQQQIFEGTGFEPIQQNQVIVGAQVYDSLVNGEASPHVLERFEQTGSDSLYELRILTQAERVAAATLLVEKGIDSEGAHEVAKALKEFSHLNRKPPEFTDYPHDAVAYAYWKLARQQSDLQARSRLIAQALRFARSETARQQVESLLTDFTIARSRPAPRLPLYRLDAADEQPRILPVVGKLPLSTENLKAVPLLEDEGIFHVVKFSGMGAWVALPGWQVVRNAEDPVILLADFDQLPGTEPETAAPETVLLLVDRAERKWHPDSYFMVDQSGQLQIEWFEEAPNVPILGRLTLVMRPKKVLDEEFNNELWQLDE